MAISKLLIANRGEVAVRVIRAAAEMGIATVAVYSEDDARGLHVTLADSAERLPGTGPAAYLDIEAIISVAKETGADAIHPGWGFLSENATFARRCNEEGIIFVGPTVATLEQLGDKARARALAAAHGVPTLKGSDGAVTLEEAHQFLRDLGPGGSMLIKAIAGGGGRGMRDVTDEAKLESAYKRCQSEAQGAFGNSAVYVEERMAPARHIEIQIAGDGSGAASHLWERDCSIQRSHQKIVEIAPSPVLHPELRERLAADALRLASALNYSGLGTFEFLVDANHASEPDGRYAFIEANPRLQVEHTITEEIFGIDLVRAQILIAGGATLAEAGVAQEQIGAPRGMAMQLRVNTEDVRADGLVRPSSGTLALFQPPYGPGIRVDSCGYAGYTTSPSFDSLLAKVIVHAPSGTFEDTVRRAERALRETHIAGVLTNVPFLKNLMEHPTFRSGGTHTTFVDEHVAELAAPREERPEVLPGSELSGHTAGAKVDNYDPLAVLTYGKARQSTTTTAVPTGFEGDPGAVLAPMQGTVVSFEVGVGDSVRKEQEIAILNAMKMEHVLRAPVAGVVRRLNAAPGDTVVANQMLLLIEPSLESEEAAAETEEVDLAHLRPDLAQIAERHELTLDSRRQEAVAKRHASGHTTARENIDALCDPGTFVEFGPLVLASDPRLDLAGLIDKSPADGIITGIGSINGEHFDDPANQCMVMSYDYMVFAGTQGARNHAKTDRALDVAERGQMPLVLFAEGGGGRAGGGGGAMRRAARTDSAPPAYAGSAGGTRTFAHFARLSGLVPMVGITTGRCFAGNASLLGCCDVIIATADSNIGMGGPAMVEGGGLGVFAPEEIGPMSIQVPNGVVDIAVEDEAEAIAVAKQYLSYFQGPLSTWEAPDQRKLRHVVPENRLRVYDPHVLLDTLCDTGSVLEIRRRFGEGMITAFGRIEGRPIGIVGNDPRFVGGAITSDGSDKAARFMQLCDAFDIPLLFLCDTPGMMVGPEVEKTALVRHCSRMFIIGANVSVPVMTIIVRKAYGLGAIAMAAGSFRSPLFTVSWPTGEFGGMGLEGSVKLGYRKELAEIEDPEERRRVFDVMVADAYERGKALNEAVIFGVDDTIDPADSRTWISTMLKSVRTPGPRLGKKRAAVDAW
jgi:acetyl/propionyl-CoA carboxylase alpha subunit